MAKVNGIKSQELCEFDSDRVTAYDDVRLWALQRGRRDWPRMVGQAAVLFPRNDRLSQEGKMRQ